MSTMTAQIMVGQAHQNHSGIQPTHVLYLHENSKAAWQLVQYQHFGSDELREKQILWIPTVENMLEDALLMAALHVLQDEPTRELAATVFDDWRAKRVVLYDVETSKLPALYESVKAIETRYKILISLFNGSTIRGQLDSLRDYEMDIEVCDSVYRREYSVWSQGVEEIGRLGKRGSDGSS